MARLGDLTLDSGPDDVAEAIVLESIRRGHRRDETVAEVATGRQESRLNPRARSANGLWWGVYQQDSGYPERGDANGQIRGFFDRLDAKRAKPGASTDPWRNIFWLQQRPGEATADDAWNDPEARRAYLTEISQPKHIAAANEYYDRFAGGAVKPPPAPAAGLAPRPDWRGDPVFLLDLLKAFGLDVYEVPGARDRGHGDFGLLGKVGWVLWHHTGNVNETDDGIAHHPKLGLAANLLIHPNGRVAITGTGIAWHGGEGIYPGIPEDGINQLSIGIECAHSGRAGDPWPPEQMRVMILVGAAITWFLGLPAAHNIAHKEWAGAENPLGINKQGKPDPVDIDMDWFRAQVGDRAVTGPAGDTGPTVTIGDITLSGNDAAIVVEAAKKMLAMWDNTDLGKPHGWYPRGMFHQAGDPTIPVDDSVGMLLNADGNVWNLLMIVGALLGVQHDVQSVKDAAAGKFPEGSYVAGNEWLAARATEFAKLLVPLCGKLTAGALTPAKPPAKKTVAKKTATPTETKA